MNRNVRNIGIVLLACVAAFSGWVVYSGSGERKAKQFAASVLIDPSSAQFRSVVRHGDWVCGEINGKNRIGAYSGFTPFYAKTNGHEGSVLGTLSGNPESAREYLAFLQQFEKNCKS